MGYNSTMKLSSLPLGARFKYPHIEDMEFVLLNKEGGGLVTHWRGIHGNSFRAIYRAAADEEEFKTLEVCDVN